MKPKSSNDSIASSAAPPNALRMWSDGLRIYVELPATKGGFCILTYDFSEGGLSKALSLLHAHRVRYDYTGTHASTELNWNRPGTATQHAIAERILRQKGIIR